MKSIHVNSRETTSILNHVFGVNSRPDVSVISREITSKLAILSALYAQVVSNDAHIFLLLLFKFLKDMQYNSAATLWYVNKRAKS